MMTKRWLILSTAACLVAASLGLILSLVSSRIFSLIVRSDILLGPDSMAEQMWENMPVPLKTSVYLFNVTNPDSVVDRGEDPHLVQRGPYVYDEYHIKKDVQWISSNDTVTYRNMRKYIFRPDLSNGTLDDMVTIINIPAATVGSMVSPILRPLASGFLRSVKEKLFATKPVREIIFDGYQDPVLTFIADLEKIVPIPGATDKFAIYYKRNMSLTYDGVYNLLTGRNGDLVDANEVYSWNYSPTMGKFKKGSRCDKVRGSGDLFPPYLNSYTPVAYFSNDLCRPIDLDYADIKYVGKTQGYSYRLTSKYFANSSVNSQNKCFEDDKRLGELPSGVYDAGPCQFRAPVYLSQPHFYQADPYFSSLLAPGSVHPNKEDHETEFVIEPQTGIPLRVLARFQANVHIKPTPNLYLFENLKHPIFFPAFWFELRMEVEGAMAAQLWLLSNLDVILRSVGFTVVGAAVSFVVISGIFFNAHGSAQSTAGGSNQSDEDQVPIIANNEDSQSARNEESSSSREDDP